jgi:hypothetical protein
MLISELIEKLAALAAEHGDVVVEVTSGCGCCEWNEEPNPKFHEPDKYDPYEYVGLN